MIESKASQDTNLLIAFDAMRGYLNAVWSMGEKQSGSLANLLSSLNRDVEANGPPLDIAQWSDWLGSVLLIEPNKLGIARAHQQLRDDYERFTRILEMGGSEQHRELAKHRAEIAGKPWHLGSEDSISVLSAFEAMRAFLSSYWNRDGRRSDDLEVIVNGLDLSEPTQMVQWNAWLAAIEAAKRNVSSG